jgi:hypothetical protein
MFGGKLQSAAWGSALVPRPSDYDWLIWSQSRNATRNIFCKGFDEKYIRIEKGPDCPQRKGRPLRQQQESANHESNSGCLLTKV